MSARNHSGTAKIPTDGEPLQRLTAEHIRQIDELLVEIGLAGEVRLIVREGEVRYMQRVTRYSVEGDEIAPAA